jgi:capsular exopolysaccharide synthesis family protein
MNTYIEIATGEPVLAELMAELNLSKPPNVKAEILPNTELIKLTVEDTDPNMAATEVYTLANILITQNRKLYTGGGISSTDVLGKQLTSAKDALDVTRQKYQDLLIQTPAAPEEIAVAQQTMDLQQNTYVTLLSQYEQASIRETMQANMITIVQPATVPLSPSSPRPLLNYALGLVIGLIGGIGLAFLFENLDTTLHTQDEIESITEMPALAKIPKAPKKALDISKNESTPFAEAFRNLATKIQLLDHQKSTKVLLVMSAEPQDGKSMIVSNLAFALAEAGKKVVAVDCDMRLPKLHKSFHLTNQFGLSDVLEQKVGLPESLQKSQYAGVTVLTSGTPPDHPSRVLGLPSTTELIDTLSKEYDYVLLDTPAFLSVVDAEILTRDANGLILVVRRNHTKRESVQMASRFLAGFQDKMIGLVTNQADSNKDYGYYQYPRATIRRLAREQQSLQDGGKKQVEKLKEPPLETIPTPSQQTDDGTISKVAEEEPLQAVRVKLKKQPTKKISKTSQSTEDVTTSKHAEEMPQQLAQVKLKKRRAKKIPISFQETDDSKISRLPKEDTLQAGQVELDR